MKAIALVLLLTIVVNVSAEVYFQDTFNDLSKWVVSKFKDSDGTSGKFEIATPKTVHDAHNDQGMKTTQDARFYQISAKFAEFSNKGKDLVIQYSVKHEQGIDCGGGYLKLGPKGLDQEHFNGDSEYNIMFGPDICGHSKRTHLIFTYKGKNHLKQSDIRTETDSNTHLYTLIVHPDNSYEVLIDGTSAAKGNIVDDFSILPPKQIKDPNVRKPSDWVDEKQMADPNDKKPAGWDDVPAQVSDPDAKKPDDWDDELDGEWEAPMIDNPNFKGEWTPKMIPNPAYKGEWEHPMINNPEYHEDKEIYAYSSFGWVGFEIWQVKSGTIFDNVIITNDINEANKLGEVTKKLQDAEKKAAAKEAEERKATEDSHDHDEEDEEDNLKDEL